MSGNSQKFILERIGFAHGSFASAGIDGCLLPVRLVKSQPRQLGNAFDNRNIPNCKFILQRLSLFLILLCWVLFTGARTIQCDKTVQPIIMHDWRREYHQLAKWIGLKGILLSVNEGSMTLDKLCLEALILVRFGIKPDLLITKPLSLGL